MTDNPRCYYCFTRTWWSKGPNGTRVPCPGKRRTVEINLTYDEARRFCAEWNSTHRPGPLSRKCEFDEQRR